MNLNINLKIVCFFHAVAKSDTSKTGNELDTSKSSVTTDENITTEIENSTSTKTTTVQPVQSDAKNHNSKQKLCLTLKANIAFNVTYIKTGELRYILNLLFEWWNAFCFLRSLCVL